MRQSPLLPAYRADAFDIGAAHGMTIALRAKLARVPDNYVADLSAVRRRLFIGGSAASWLSQRGVAAPERLLEFNELESGAAIVRLHRQQYLLIDGLEASPYDELFSLAEGRHDNVLVVAYEAAEIACGGKHTDAVLAELCPMDVSAVTGPVWIATRLGHCEAALRRIPIPAGYRIVCSPADSRFLFGILCELALECDGAILGFDDYRALLNRGD